MAEELILPSGRNGSSRVRVRVFEPLPTDFKPLTASDELLRRHGFPPRPELSAAPALRQVWDNAFSRRLKHIVPTFRQVDPGPHATSPLSLPASVLPFWSGVVASGVAGSLNWITASWTVPNVYPSSTGWAAGVWIGLDGADVTTGDLLYAGTMIGTGASYFAVGWDILGVTWIPLATGLPVSPGDSVRCLICAPDATDATIYAMNLTSLDYTSFVVTAPGSRRLVGNSAEWIVSAGPVPGFYAGSVPHYGEVYFDQAYAGGALTSPIVEAGSGKPISIVDASGSPVSVPVVKGSKLIKMISVGS